MVRPLVENLTKLVGAFLLEPITPETVWRLETELQKQLQETGRQLLEDLFNHIEPDDADALPKQVEAESQLFSRKKIGRAHV